MIPFNKKEALPEVQQRVVPQKINEHFALKAQRTQSKYKYPEESVMIG